MIHLILALKFYHLDFYMLFTINHSQYYKIYTSSVRSSFNYLYCVVVVTLSEDSEPW